MHYITHIVRKSSILRKLYVKFMYGVKIMIALIQIREKLIEAIKQSEISQTQLAKQIGIGQQTISAYLRGKAMPALDTFANLCAVLDIDANEILCVDKYKPD